MATENTKQAVDTISFQSEEFSGLNTKVSKIRYLDSLGYTKSEIVQIFNLNGEKMIYQHVRNELLRIKQ